MKIFTTKRFERRLVKFVKGHPEFSTKVRLAMKKLAIGSPASALKIHRLSGPLENCLAYNLSYDYRLIFIVDEEGICFLDIGTHDDVYR